MTERLEVVNTIFDNPAFDAALWDVQGAQVRQGTAEVSLFETMVSARQDDDTTITTTRDHVSDLLEIIQVDGDKATIYDADICNYMSDIEIATFWKGRKGTVEALRAKDKAVEIGGALAEDDLVRWGLARNLRPANLIHSKRSTLKEKVSQTVGALDRTDTVLRTHPNELVTYLNRVGYVSAWMNDGHGLTGIVESANSAQLGGNSSFSLRNDVLPPYNKPILFAGGSASNMEMVDASDPDMLTGDWPAILRSSTWNLGSPRLLFGEPASGPLYMEDYARQESLGILHENLKYYESGIRNARIVAALAMGDLTIEDVEKQGITLYSAHSTKQTA